MHHSVINVVNGLETLPKLARHYYFPIFPWIRDKLSLKMSALVTSDIFRLFVNTLTPDVKDSRRNMQIFWQQLSNAFISKSKEFFWFFIAFLKCAWNLQRSEKQEGYPSLIIADIIASRKRSLVKRLKGLASADHSVINVLMDSKHCWCQHGSTIFLFLHEFEINWAGKCLP